MPDEDIKWTVETLARHITGLSQAQQKHYDFRFDALDKKISDSVANVKTEVALAMAASKEAVTKAETASNERLAGMNEFRQSIQDISKLQITRTEVEQKFMATADKLGALEKWRDGQAGRSSGLGSMWGYVVGAIGLIATLYSFLRLKP